MNLSETHAKNFDNLSDRHHCVGAIAGASYLAALLLSQRL